MEKYCFTAKDIVKIIIACRKSRVSTLTLGELRLEFQKVDQLTETDDLSKTSRETKQLSLFKPTYEGDLDKISEESSIQSQGALNDEEMALLMIEDPTRYEDLLAQGALEDEKAQA